MPKSFINITTILKWLFFGIFFFLLFFKPIELEDIWWHLGVGRWILENGRFPQFDIFPMTSEAHPWMLTQAGGSLFYYSIYKLFGFFGLKLVRLFLIALVFGLIIYRYCRKISHSRLVFFCFVLAIAVVFRTHLRPYLFNLLFISVYLNFFLDIWATNKIRPRSYLIIFLSSAIWFNLHYGSIIYGVSLIGIFLLATIVRYLNNRNNIRTFNFQTIKIFFLILLVHCMGLFVNPFGYQGVFYAFNALLNPSGIIHGYVVGTVAEIDSPLFLLSLNGLIYFFLLITALSIVSRKKSEKFLGFVLLIFSFALFIYSARAGIFFSLIAVYVIFENSAKVQTESLFQKISILSILVILILSNVVLFQRHIVKDGQNISYLNQLFSWRTPIALTEFINKHHLHGNVINSMGIGGFLNWTSYPNLKPFVDGRQANPIQYGEFIKTINNPIGEFIPLQEKYKFDLAIFDGNHGGSRSLVNYLVQQEDWKLIYLEGPIVMFIQENSPIATKELLDYEDKIKNSTVYMDDWEAANTLISSKQISFFAPQHIDLLDEGGFLFSQGFYQEGFNRLYQAASQTHSPIATQLLEYAIKTIVGSN